MSVIEQAVVGRPMPLSDGLPTHRPSMAPGMADVRRERIQIDPSRTVGRRPASDTPFWARLLRVDDEAWSSLLARVPHDFYHVPGYVALCARQEGGEPRALLVENAGRAMLLPLIVRPIAGGGRDATSPYGYPGPLLSDPEDATFFRAALLHGIRLLEAEGLISLFVRLHPLLNRAIPEGVGTLVRHGDTVVVDLTLPEDTLWRQTRRNHRQQIERAIAAGHHFAIDAGPRHQRDFRRLYRQTMDRACADTYYRFDDAYFDGLQVALGDTLHLGTVEIDGIVGAAGLLVETDGIVQMHLSGSDRRFDTSAPMKLLFDGVRRWAKERGDHWLHLGGGRGSENDSLLRFKAGFSPLHQVFRSLRVVIREQEYVSLVGLPGPTSSLTAGYFPLYRQA